jgi:putative hydrolase of the HAD superfamily
VIQGIIFDFGGVLWAVEDEAAWEAHQDATAVELGFENRAALESYIYGGEAWRLARVGRISDAEFWQRLLEPFGLATPQARHEWVQRLYAPTHGVHPRMNELLGRLRGHYKLALLSNASDWVGEVLFDEYQLYDAFDVAVVSALVGLAKPDPAIYELTLSRLGLPAPATLFIDDQARNVRAAEALGISAIVFPGVEELWAELAARGVL